MFDFAKVSVEELTARQLDLAEMDLDTATTDELEEREQELLAIKAELETRKAAAKAAEEERESVANGAGETKDEFKEERKMDLKEIRNSQEYIEAYANFIKSGDASECRSLLTVNAPQNGTLPVPDFLQEMIETAWERDEVLSRVSKSYLRGNIRIPFELSADDAVVHEEGTEAPAEEQLTFGLVTLTPKSIKKWVSFSDEVQDMKGEEFLRYIYEELTYRVTKKLADLVLDDITTAPTDNTATAIGVPKVAKAPALTTIPEAAAHLHEDARNLVVIMNRLTEIKFLEAHAAGNFAIDPFVGITRIYSSHLPVYDNASAGDVYAIVGDLGGERVNYPAGDGMVIKYDELTRKKEDIVEVLGRQYAAHGITKLGRFANITKPNA